MRRPKRGSAALELLLNSSELLQPTQPSGGAGNASAPFHASAVDAVSQLRARFPDAPFLTLGQTVLWDEPVKAAFCRILEAVAPEATIVAAIHDTDYFAKLALPDAPESSDSAASDSNTAASEMVAQSEIGAQPKFAMMGHNDGATRGLWSAAGELSCLFGAEIVPSRAMLAESGVAFDRVARDYPGGADALLNRETEAWGWRALVHTEPHPLIAADVRLRDIGLALREQLEWGFAQSLKTLGDAPIESQRVAQQLRDWIHEYSCSAPNGTLSDLYGWLSPRLWGLVRGGGACNLQSDNSMHMFRFNRQTFHLPRFRFVDLFLQRETRDVARRCYDDALSGSGIYTLGQFGEGALPFDVVLPGLGRGTLRLHEGSLYIETETPITLCTGCDCASIEELAGALEDRFGPDVVLVGKAVALISMLAAEYIFVFHEKASGYTSRTQLMNQCLRQSGIELPLHPMLRVKYTTWDALSEVTAHFSLPPHLAQAFGKQTVSASEFAARWELVCQGQDDLRARLKARHSPRDLMTFLAQNSNDDVANGAALNGAAANGVAANGDQASNEVLDAASPSTKKDSATEAPTQSASMESVSSDETVKSAASSIGARDWKSALHEYSQARAVIRSLRKRTEVLERETDAFRQSTREATQRGAETERAKGRDWRGSVQPLRTRLFDLKEAAATRLAAPQLATSQSADLQSATGQADSNGDVPKLSREERREKARLEAELEAREEQEIADLRKRIAACIEERAHFDHEISEQRGQAHESTLQARARIEERVRLEKSPESQAARMTIARLEYEAELMRFQRTRDAILVSQGLRLTNYRPTAWWFPLVSPDHRWFKQLAQTAQARIEEL